MTLTRTIIIDNKEKIILDELNKPENIEGISFNKLFNNLLKNLLKMAKETFSKKLISLEKKGIITRTKNYKTIIKLVDNQYSKCKKICSECGRPL
jgi:DNA-binding HxlR family transcriptional regulator